MKKPNLNFVLLFGPYGLISFSVLLQHILWGSNLQYRCLPFLLVISLSMFTGCFLLSIVFTSTTSATWALVYQKAVKLLVLFITGDTVAEIKSIKYRVTRDKNNYNYYTNKMWSSVYVTYKQVHKISWILSKVTLRKNRGVPFSKTTSS